MPPMKSTMELFTPNAHSAWRIDTVPTAAEEAVRVADVARRMHPSRTLLRQENVVRVNEGLRSKNFIATDVWDDGSEERVIYRADSIAPSSEAVEKRAELIDYLADAGVSVPRSLPVDAGTERYVLTLDDIPWQRFHYVEGDHYRGRMDELIDAGRGIGKLHAALKSYPYADSFPATPYGTLETRLWQEALDAVKGTPVAASILEHRALTLDALPSVIRTVERLAQEGYGEEQLLHNDLHPQNLICNDGKLAAIIDFGNIAKGSVGLDIGMAFHRLVRQHLIDTNDRSPETLGTAGIAFTHAYLSENPNFANAMPYLPDYMRELILRKVSMVLTQFAAGKRPEAECMNELTKFIGLLGEIDVIAEVCFTPS